MNKKEEKTLKAWNLSYAQDCHSPIQPQNLKMHNLRTVQTSKKEKVKKRRTKNKLIKRRKYGNKRCYRIYERKT